MRPIADLSDRQSGNNLAVIRWAGGGATRETGLTSPELNVYVNYTVRLTFLMRVIMPLTFTALLVCVNVMMLTN